jgi:hypothetical protein
MNTLSFRRPSAAVRDGSLLSADFASGQLSCAEGEIALGGGGRIGSGGVANTALTHSKPIEDGSGRPVGWDVIILNASGTAQPVAVYATCAKLS